jgi:hypothetical protein
LSEVPRVTGCQAYLSARQCQTSYGADHPRPVAVLELRGIGDMSPCDYDLFAKMREPL